MRAAVFSIPAAALLAGACGAGGAAPVRDAGAGDLGQRSDGDGDGVAAADRPGDAAGPADAVDSGAAGGAWVLGYYAGYQRDAYPVAEIAWSDLTHVAVAFYLPRGDGSLDETLFLDAVAGPALGHQLVDAAHASGRRALASIGGAGLHAQWVAAAADATRGRFVASLGKLLSDYGYDGLDLDWEPVDAADAPALRALVAALRAAAPGATLTMPVGYENVNLPGDLSLYAALAADLDQINVMTYGMAGAYPGWKSWHSSALYQTDPATPTSVDSSVKAYLRAGVPAAKLGVGAGFYGLCYTPPVSAPDQALGASAIVADDGTMSFAHIAAAYGNQAPRQWDATAHATYLSFGAATGPEGCGYVSYEDERSMQDKGAYLRANHLGGVIIWTINQGYLGSQPAGQRNPLLDALGAAVLR